MQWRLGEAVIILVARAGRTMLMYAPTVQKHESRHICQFIEWSSNLLAHQDVTAGYHGSVMHRSSDLA